MSRRDCRPVPEGFAKDAKLPNSVLRVKYQALPAVLARWRRELGMPRGNRKSKMPADFAQIGNTKTAPELAAIYRVTEQTITKWRRMAGISMVCKMTPPADLAEQARTKCLTALSDHYGICQTTMSRLLNEAGIRPAKFIRPRRKVAASPYVVTPVADTSLEAAAANELRRAGYANVYRCNSAGIPSPRGDHWRAGTVILTPAQLIERAQRKGFDPSPWRIAA